MKDSAFYTHTMTCAYESVAAEATKVAKVKLFMIAVKIAVAMD